MFDLNVLIHVEMQILLFFVIGMVLKKKGITDHHIDGFLSTFVLNLIMPMSIFVSFYKSISTEILKSSIMLVVAGIVVAILVIILGRFIPKSMSEDKRRIAQYAILISNGSLIGLPLIYGLCGDTGVFYANIFMIPTRILSFTSGEKYFNPQYKGASVFTVIKNFILNPITLAMICGFALNACQIQIPGGVNSVFESLSACMTPLALILVGSTLVDSADDIKKSSFDILGISFFRLILSPLLTYFICLLLRIDLSMTIVAVLINATPVASTATIFAQKYKGDTLFSSNCVFLSTVFSFVTLWGVCLTMAGI